MFSTRVVNVSTIHQSHQAIWCTYGTCRILKGLIIAHPIFFSLCSLHLTSSSGHIFSSVSSLLNPHLLRTSIHLLCPLAPALVQIKETWGGGKKLGHLKWEKENWMVREADFPLPAPSGSHSFFSSRTRAELVFTHPSPHLGFFPQPECTQGFVLSLHDLLPMWHYHLNTTF